MHQVQYRKIVSLLSLNLVSILNSNYILLPSILYYTVALHILWVLTLISRVNQTNLSTMNVNKKKLHVSPGCHTPMWKSYIPYVFIGLCQAPLPSPIPIGVNPKGAKAQRKAQELRSRSRYIYIYTLVSSACEMQVKHCKNWEISPITIRSCNNNST